MTPAKTPTDDCDRCHTSGAPFDKVARCYLCEGCAREGQAVTAPKTLPRVTTYIDDYGTPCVSIDTRGIPDIETCADKAPAIRVYLNDACIFDAAATLDEVDPGDEALISAVIAEVHFPFWPPRTAHHDALRLRLARGTR